MNILEVVESAGNAHHRSEDRVGSQGNIAWVIDGATDFTNERTLSGETNVHWLVDFVQTQLIDAGASRVTTSAHQLLDKLARDVREAMSQYDLSKMRSYPVCSIGLVIENDVDIELARIGDAVLIAAIDDKTIEVRTSFFDNLEATAVADAKRSKMRQSDVVDAMIKRRLANIKGIYGESVFSGYPDAKLNIASDKISRDSGARVLVCTDGLARAVNDYGLFSSWSSLISHAAREGLSGIVADIRQYEEVEADEDGGRFKRSDDIAAIMLDI